MKILHRIIDMYFEEREREKERNLRNQLRSICNELCTTHDRFTRNYYLKYENKDKELFNMCLDIAEISAPKEKIKQIKKLKRKLNNHKIYWKLENNFN